MDSLYLVCAKAVISYQSFINHAVWWLAIWGWELRCLLSASSAPSPSSSGQCKVASGLSRQLRISSWSLVKSAEAVPSIQKWRAGTELLEIPRGQSSLHSAPASTAFSGICSPGTVQIWDSLCQEQSGDWYKWLISTLLESKWLSSLDNSVSKCSFNRGKTLENYDWSFKEKKGPYLVD